jgi:hypothetical protein
MIRLIDFARKQLAAETAWLRLCPVPQAHLAIFHENVPVSGHEQFCPGIQAVCPWTDTSFLRAASSICEHVLY